MTVKDVFDLRKQGKIEEAYEAIRPMYRVHKGRYTTLCMFWVASDIFKKRMDEGRTEEARKIFEALKRMQPRVDAINKELDNQTAAKWPEKITSNSQLSPFTAHLSPVPDPKLPWEKNDQQHSPATAFLQYAEKRLYKNVPEAQPLNLPDPQGNGLRPRGANTTLSAAQCGAPTPLHSTPLHSTPPKLSRLLSILYRPLSVREMMAALNFHSRDKFLKNYLSPALKSGLVEMTQPDSPKSPKQKYRRSQGDK